MEREKTKKSVPEKSEQPNNRKTRIKDIEWFFKNIICTYLPIWFCIVIGLVAHSFNSVNEIFMNGDIILSSCMVVLFSIVDAFENKMYDGNEEQHIYFYTVLILLITMLAVYIGFKLNENKSMTLTYGTNTMCVLTAFFSSAEGNIYYIRGEG